MNFGLTDATVTYDALGRMTGYVEAATAVLPGASLSWAYDAAGNIRRSTASYVTLDRHGVASGPLTTQYWYRYDAMNRLVTDRGTLANGQIVRGMAGQDIQYDAAGQRVGVLRTESYAYYQNYVYETRESYAYDAGGRVAQIRQSTGQVTIAPPPPSAPPPAPAGGTLRSSFGYDLLGHQTQQNDYDANGVVYSRGAAYGLDGRIFTESVSTKKTDNATYTTNTGYYYGSGASYALGNAVIVNTYNTRNSVFQSSGTTTNGYRYWDGAVQSSIQYQPNSGSGGSTAFTYDELGTLRRVQVTDGRSHGVAFETDIDGQIIRRDEEDNRGQGNPHEIWYRFNGRQLGYTGNNGTDDMTEAASIEDRKVIAPSTPGAFRGGQLAGSSYADFAQSYDPLNSYAQGSGAGSYTVHGGESLQAIAQNLWGDAGLWYKLAEANGLSAGSALTEGMTLRLPAGVVRTTHNANTLTPYDPAEAIGDVSPTSPQPNKPKKNKCGVFGQILLVVIAVAVSALTYGALTGPATTILGGIAAGAVAGAAGSIASQAFGVASGIQQKFDFKGVAIAALGGAIGGGIGEFARGATAAAKVAEAGGKALSTLGKVGNFLGGSGFINGAVRGALSNTLMQGIGVAVGLQSKFDFAGVAVGAIVGGVVNVTNIGGFGGRLTSGVAGALAGGAARSVLSGTSFGDNVLAALPDVIGSTIGERIAGSLSGERTARASSTDGDTVIAQAAYDRGTAAYPRNVAFFEGPQDDGYIQSDIIVTAQRAIDEARGFFDRLWSGVKSAGDWLFNGSSRNGYQSDALVMRIGKAIDDGLAFSRLAFKIHNQAVSAGWNYVSRNAAAADARYHVTSRALGALQAAGGGMEVVSGGALTAAGIAGEPVTLGASTVAVIGGSAVVVMGADNVQAGVRRIWTGGETSTLGGKAMSGAFGLSPNGGELAYGGLQLATGVGGAIAGARVSRQAAMIAAESAPLSPFSQRYLTESGGRWGGTATRQQNYAISQELERRGYTVTDGGGIGPEEYIAGAGPGSKGSTYADISATAANGRKVRIQTVTTRTLPDGTVVPTASEAAAAARIRAAFPNDKLLLVPKR